MKKKNHMIKICPLASGSKGNSIFIETKNAKILIDAGLSFLQLTKRLNQINVSIEDIDAILITHEHMDHIQALKVIADKVNVPVLANSDTAKGIYNNLHVMPKMKIFTTGEEFEFKDMKILPFSIQHDTLDPVGFIIKNNSYKMGFCADIGFVTSLVKNTLKGCDYLYLEANHQVSMVHSSERSYVYKQRVLGRQGHLSNVESFSLLKDLINPKLKYVQLAHISLECNSKDLLKEMIEKFSGNKKNTIKLFITYQDSISDKIELT